MNRRNTTVKKRPSKRAKTKQEKRSTAKSTAKEKPDTKDQCPECDGTLIEDAEHGEIICRECGLVVDEETIDHGPEWRAFDSQEREQKKRTGAPMTETMHDKGLTTNIGWQDKDANGNPLSSRKRQQMGRLRKWDQRSKANNKERGLKAGLSEISRMVSALGISNSAKETACMMFRRAQEDELLQGRSIEGMASAAVYAAARLEDIPRTLDQINRVSRVEEKEIKGTYWYLNKELNLKIGPTDPAQYLPQFASELDVDEETKRIAHDWIANAKEANAISGSAPNGIAAAALYAASQLSGNVLTQGEIAEVADITAVTVRNQHNNLIEHADLSWI